MTVLRRVPKGSLFYGKLLLLFSLVAWAFLLSSHHVFLLMENNETQVPLFWLKARSNRSFSLSFKHSYDKAMYIEHYKINGSKGFVLTGITFRSDLNGQGFIFSNPKYLANGWGSFQKLHEVMANISFMMGSPDQANHTLTIKGKRFLLTKYAPPGTPVRLVAVNARRYKLYVWKLKKWIK